MNRLFVGVTAVIVFLIPLFAQIDQAYSQTLPGFKKGQALVIYGIESKGEKLRHEMIWVPFNAESGKYISQIGKANKLTRIDGKKIYTQKFEDKSEIEYYYFYVNEGAYVLHSLKAKASITTFHPLSMGFEAKEGDILFLGHFLVWQDGAVFRSFIDPKTGVSLELKHIDPAKIPWDRRKLKAAKISGIENSLTAYPPIYFKVTEYE
ncbi:MAG: hypothetical protein IIA70_06685 [Proteobacteria bacterium]|nr:hypothetical protein [Pseudomonadota bacterium]